MQKDLVSGERRFATCLIVAELLRHGERESERTMVSLESIDSPYDDFDLAGGIGHVLTIASLSRPSSDPFGRQLSLSVDQSVSFMAPMTIRGPMHMRPTCQPG